MVVSNSTLLFQGSIFKGAMLVSGRVCVYKYLLQETNNENVKPCSEKMQVTESLWISSSVTTFWHKILCMFHLLSQLKILCFTYWSWMSTINPPQQWRPERLWSWHPGTADVEGRSIWSNSKGISGVRWLQCIYCNIPNLDCGVILFLNKYKQILHFHVSSVSLVTWDCFIAFHSWTHLITSNWLCTNTCQVPPQQSSTRNQSATPVISTISGLICIQCSWSQLPHWVPRKARFHANLGLRNNLEFKQLLTDRFRFQPLDLWNHGCNGTMYVPDGLHVHIEKTI